MGTSEYNVKIADFGLSTFASSNPREKLYEKCGTPCYAAPEILRGLGYTSKCDMFSLGSLFFNLVTGRYLFPGTNKMQVMKKNKECDLAWIHDYLNEITPTCKDLILQFLEIDACKRPTARESLMHPWFKQNEEAIMQLLQMNENLAKPTILSVGMQPIGLMPGPGQGLITEMP